ncbi:MAG TPA: glycosyltransferase family 39 protein [Dehalococcoidia bacterium]|nr:glycosyltransferase family 39 protein [Dehalococcoidia bacterium]
MTGRRAVVSGLTIAGWTAVLTGVLIYLLVYIDFAAQLAAYPFDFDQGEGYDVNSGWLLAQGGWIYNDNSVFPFYSSNYPPIYSWVLAGLIQIFGVSIGLGRVLSAVAAGCTVLVIAAGVRRHRAPWAVAGVAGLLYLASPYVFHTTPLARVNALAILAALATVYAFDRATPRWTAAGIALALIALYTKQTTLDAVAAGILYLFCRRWNLGLVALVVIEPLAIAVFVALDYLSIGQFWVNIIAGNVNPFDWDQAQTYFRDYVSIHLPVVAGAIGSCFWAVWRRRLTAFHLYFMISLPVTLTAGKWGAGESYFLGNIAAACVCLGWWIGELWGWRGGWVARVLAPVALAWQMVLFAHGPLDDLVPGWRDRSVQAGVLGTPPSAADVAAGRQLTDYFTRHQGYVLAEENGFAIASGLPVVGNASHLRNLYQSGDWDPAGLVAAIDDRVFGTVVLSGYHYPEPVMQALLRNYRSAERFWINGFGYLVLVRRDA